MTRRICLLLLFALLAGCPSGPRGADRKNTAVLRIRCDVPDAVIWIDDRMAGLVSDVPGGGIRISPGLHRLELRHDRYHSRYLEVTLERGEERTVEVKLAEILD